MMSPQRDVSKYARLGARDCGFTLVELMVTLVVAIVLLTIAVPSFRQITISNQLTTAANEVVLAVNTARMEAIKRNASTQLCSDTAANNASDALGTACGTSIGVVMATTSAGTTTVRDSNLTLAGSLKLQGTMTALRFNAQGLARSAASTGPFGGTVVDICTTAYSTNNHRKVVMVAGSVISVDSSSGDCSS